MKAFLDTHAAVALFAGKLEVFERRSVDLLERAAIFVSPFVRLELAFLHEIERVRPTPEEIMNGLLTDCGVTEATDRVDKVVAEAMTIGWTRDPFDRLLVATAKLHRAPFVTRDSNIHEHFENAVW